jgi:hypothetical protein
MAALDDGIGREQPVVGRAGHADDGAVVAGADEGVGALRQQREDAAQEAVFADGTEGFH